MTYVILTSDGNEVDPWLHAPVRNTVSVACGKFGDR